MALTNIDDANTRIAVLEASQVNWSTNHPEGELVTTASLVAAQLATDQALAATVAQAATEAQAAAVKATTDPLNAEIATLQGQLAAANAQIATLTAQLAGVVGTRTLTTTKVQEISLTLQFGTGSEAVAVINAMTDWVNGIALKQVPAILQEAIAKYMASDAATRLQVCALIGHPDVAAMSDASQLVFWANAGPMLTAMGQTADGQAVIGQIMTVLGM